MISQYRNIATIEQHQIWKKKLMIILKEIFSLLWISRKMVLAFLAVAVISALLYLKYTPKTFDVVIKVGYTKNFSRAIPDNILLEELQTHKYQNALIEPSRLIRKLIVQTILLIC